MSSIPKTYEEIQAKIDALKAQGKTESTSKEVGKLVNALKVLKPAGFRESDITQAKSQLLNSTTPQTQENLGILPAGSTASATKGTGLGGNGGTSPINLQNTYQSALDNAGVKNLESELAAKENALNTALADINDNPFYTEATRVGKEAKLKTQALNDINSLQNRINSAKADAQVKLNIATQQYNIDSQEYQKNLTKLNMLINSGAIVGASSKDIAQIAMATGMSTGMVQGIINQTKQNQAKLQVATDNNGNVTIYDINTGKVVNTIPGVGGAKVGTGATKTPTTNKYLNQASKFLAEADTAFTGKGTEDKLLSKQEQQDAYNKILALVGGDAALAQSVFMQAWNTGGYNNYGE